MFNIKNIRGNEICSLTGQRLWAADNGFKRHNERGERYERIYDRYIGFEENVLLNMAFELKAKGLTPDPNISLEEWVDRETGGEFNKQIERLSW